MELGLSRTQIFLRVPQLSALGVVAKRRKTTQSALIREAVDEYLRDGSAQLRKKQLDALAGSLGPNAFEGFDLRALRDEERSF